MLVVRVALTLLLSACGRESNCRVADCSVAIRRDAITYVEAGFTGLAAKRAGRAANSECEDGCGPDSRGAYFPEDTKQIRVWRFPGQAPAEVLGVRIEEGRFRIFIAEGIDAKPILKALKAD